MNRRYFIIFVAIMAIIITAFLVAFSITSGSSDDQRATAESSLADYANTTKTMKLTIAGNLRANSEYREYQITVGQNRSNLTILGGYQGNVLDTKSYDNNSAAYREFLAAIDKAGYTLGDDSSDAGGVLGACATGRRYQVQIWDGNQMKQNYWTSSCRIGNFKGNIDKIITLFRWQIPEFDPLTRNYPLN